MNTSLAIQKAVEGGWVCKACLEPEKNYLWYLSDMLLDPLFWQALGKTEGWKPEEETGVETQDIALGLGFGGSEYVWFNGPEWKLKQYCLIDAIQQGRSIHEFFGEILKK